RQARGSRSGASREALGSAWSFPRTPDSGLKESIHVDTCLPKNRAKCSLRHITRVIRNRGVALRRGVVPDFVAARRLTVELQIRMFEDGGLFPCSESPPGGPIKDQLRSGKLIALQQRGDRVCLRAPVAPQ